MAIAYRSAASIVGSATSPLTANYPATINATDLIVAGALAKHNTATATTPAGFTSHLRKTGGAGTNGTSDEGTLSLEVFTRESVSGAEAGTTYSQAFAGFNMGMASSIAMSRGSPGWLITAAGGSLNTGGSTTITMVSDETLDLATGDRIVGFMAINTDADGSPGSGNGVTLTAPGITFGTSTQRRSAISTAGADAFLTVFECSVTGSGTVTVTLTATSSTSATNRPAGAMVLLRLREGVAGDTTLAATATATATRQFAALSDGSTKFVRVSSPATGGGYLAADPALATDDLIEYERLAGSYEVTVAPNGAFSLAGSPVEGRYLFNYRIHDPVDGVAGPWGPQTLLVRTPPTVTTVQGSTSGVNLFYNGEPVTITGTDFGSVTGRVYVGTTQQTPTSWTDTSITFTASVAAVGGYTLFVVKGT